MSEHCYRYRRRLPHVRAVGTTYAVTWRLAILQPPLTPESRTLVSTTLLARNDCDYHLYAFVVMDDHVHTVVQPIGDKLLESVVQAWKSVTAHAICKNGGSPPVWQDEYRDRAIRNDRELATQLQYVANNPFRCWQDIRQYDWLWIRQDEP